MKKKKKEWQKTVQTQFISYPAYVESEMHRHWNGKCMDTFTPNTFFTTYLAAGKKSNWHNLFGKKNQCNTFFLLNEMLLFSIWNIHIFWDVRHLGCKQEVKLIMSAQQKAKMVSFLWLFKQRFLAQKQNPMVL